MGDLNKQLVYPKRDIVMEDIQITEEDIQELFTVMPEAQLRVTIIAQKRRIQELENTVDAKSKDKLDIKKAKVS